MSDLVGNPEDRFSCVEARLQYIPSCMGAIISILTSDASEDRRVYLVAREMIFRL